MNIVGHLIHGAINETHSRLQDIYNPATGEVSRQVAIAPKATVEDAIDAAHKAFPQWRDTPDETCTHHVSL